MHSAGSCLYTEWFFTHLYQLGFDHLNVSGMDYSELSKLCLFPLHNKKLRCRQLKARISVLEITKDQSSFWLPILLHLVKGLQCMVSEWPLCFQTVNLHSRQEEIKNKRKVCVLTESVSFYQKYNLFSRSSTSESSVYILIGQTSR